MTQILVVEDDPAIGDLIAEDLSSRGYDVALARNGQDALTQLEASQPAAIILDLMMPVVDGWTFLHDYRARMAGSKTPVVVVSAGGHLNADFEALGVRRYLPKPFDLEELAVAVSDAIAS